MNNHDECNGREQMPDGIPGRARVQEGGGDSLSSFSALLAATQPRADDDFRRGLEERSVAVLRERRERTAGRRSVAPRPRSRRGWKTPTPGFPRWATGLAAMLLLAAVMTGTVVAAVSYLRVERPEEPSGEIAMFPPILPPAGSELYRPMDPARAAKESGLAVAYLRQPPAGVAEKVEVDVRPQADRADPDEVSIAIRSLVRYRGNGHTVLVVLDEPSPAMARKELLSLGDRTIRLSDGREAWVSEHPEWPQGNAVASVVDRYVVVVASDLPAEQVRALASRVVVAPPSGEPAERGIPSSWPLPATEASDADGVEMTVSGDIESGGTEDRPYLRFDCTIGQSRGGEAEDVRVQVAFPPALEGRKLEAYPAIPYGKTGPGWRAGFGGEIAFDTSGMGAPAVRNALGQGITVRVTWTEDGQPRQRTFAIR